MNGQVANLAAGLTPEQVVHSYPSLTSEAIPAALASRPETNRLEPDGAAQTAPAGCIALSGGRTQIASMYT